MPWDYDGDVVYDYAEKHKIDDLISSKQNVVTSEAGNKFLLRTKGAWFVIIDAQTGFFVDVFPLDDCYEVDAPSDEFLDQKLKKKLKTCRFDSFHGSVGETATAYQVWFPSKECPFLGSTFPCPQDIDDVLTAMVGGRDWRIPDRTVKGGPKADAPMHSTPPARLALTLAKPKPLPRVRVSVSPRSPSSARAAIILVGVVLGGLVV